MRLWPWRSSETMAGRRQARFTRRLPCRLRSWWDRSRTLTGSRFGSCRPDGAMPAPAADDRSTIGMRVTGATPSWDYALQPSHQYGSFGSADIAAGGGAGDVGWHPDIFGHPRF